MDVHVTCARSSFRCDEKTMRADNDMDVMEQALKTHFGHETFRAGQRHIVDMVLAGRDTLVLMPTGGGKSLTYQLPALLRPGLTVVISPLIALMQDQVSALSNVVSCDPASCIVILGGRVQN